MKNENLYRIYLKARNMIAYAHQNNLFNQKSYMCDFGPYEDELCEIVIQINSAARKDGLDVTKFCFPYATNIETQCKDWSCATCELKALADMFQKYAVSYV